jgi:hypothetical protein
MPRVCTICTHPDRAEIDRALVSGEALRGIARRFAASEDACFRHRSDHLPAHVATAKAAADVAQADDLLSQVRDLHRLALHLLARASAAGDLRTALAGVREARACIETLLEVEGELDRRPQVNVLIAPEWVMVRSALLEALAPYPEARAAVAGRLVALEAGR